MNIKHNFTLNRFIFYKEQKLCLSKINKYLYSKKNIFV
jgi:hypothetical protein